jgi:hypothetical protein
MTGSSRTEFLRIAAAASLAKTKGSLLWAGAPAKKLRAWSTSKDRKYEGIAVPEWRTLARRSPIPLAVT